MCQHETTDMPIPHWQHPHQQQIGFQEANRLTTESSQTSLSPPLMIPNTIDSTYDPFDYQYQHRRQFSSSSTASPWTIDYSPVTPPSAQQQDVILTTQSFYDSISMQQDHPSKQTPISTTLNSGKMSRSMGETIASHQQKQDLQKNLRFHTVLQAMTAVTQKSELPLCYLNRNQAYGIQLADKMGNDGLIRSQLTIAFHDPSHRKLALNYWKFWIAQHKDPDNARSLDIDTHQSIGILNVRYPSFDRIVFDWHGRHGAKVFVRFHCLSTDFSRIKGIKGIPLRVCMSSQVSVVDHNSLFQRNYAGAFHPSDKGETDMTYTEKSFAMVKLFRDKGAERKYKDDAKQLGKQFEKILHDGDSTMHPMWLMYNQSMPYATFRGIADAPNDVSPTLVCNDMNGYQQRQEKLKAKRLQTSLSHYQQHSHYYHPYTKRSNSDDAAATGTLPPSILTSMASGTTTVPTQLYFSGHDSVLSSSSPPPLMSDNGNNGHSVVAPIQQKADLSVAPPFSLSHWMLQTNSSK